MSRSSLRQIVSSFALAVLLSAPSVAFGQEPPLAAPIDGAVGGFAVRSAERSMAFCAGSAADSLSSGAAWYPAAIAGRLASCAQTTHQSAQVAAVTAAAPLSNRLHQCRAAVSVQNIAYWQLSDDDRETVEQWALDANPPFVMPVTFADC